MLVLTDFVSAHYKHAWKIGVLRLRCQNVAVFVVKKTNLW